jgi:hypothetical protein
MQVNRMVQVAIGSLTALQFFSQFILYLVEV